MNDQDFDRTIEAALQPRPGDLLSSEGMVAAVRASRERRPPHRRLLIALALALGAVLAVGAVGVAAGVFRTVPVQVHVTQPTAGADAPAPTAVDPAFPYTTSLAKASAIAGYPILALAPGAGMLKSVTVLPPHTLPNGKPFPADEILKPSFALVYDVDGKQIQIDESPTKPSSTMQFWVKSYGAANTHTATVDGFDVVYEGSAENVDFIGFQTASGTAVFLSIDSGVSNGSPSPVRGLTLNDWSKLISGMS